MKQFIGLMLAVIIMAITLVWLRADKLETNREYNSNTRITTVWYLDGHTNIINWTEWWGD